MLNRDIYQTDPSTYSLPNKGVASLNDAEYSDAQAVLRFELEHFVCEGQYEAGTEHVLSTYLANLGQPQQDGVWVSGFYGSGKSHLVKMLRALWVNTEFDDGARARNLAPLPQNVRDALHELETAGKHHGGLHAAAGTLGASASGSVRLAILSIVFKSVVLPEKYHLARFVMWLQKEGILQQVRAYVEQRGDNWEEELDNLYVADGLNEALRHAKPDLFSSPAACADTLRGLYPLVSDVSSEEMLRTIRSAVSRNDAFPLTLVVLDELQQFIGDDGTRAHDVQEAVEACCKGLGSRFLFVATGQTAITGTPSLKRLEGRFTRRIELSDADVDTVIRKTVLAKKPAAVKQIEDVVQDNLGEIARHLAGTTLGHRQDDALVFAQDYPILPVRRRFWEAALRVLDVSGTQSQLRNQLTMVHQAAKSSLEAPLGTVVAADYLYFDAADKLLQSRVLPRNVYEQTMTWLDGNSDERLIARACGLVFLVNRLSSSNTDVGIKATPEVLADLLVEDLTQGSAGLRSRLAALLDGCKLLTKVDDEYRIQTDESRLWHNEFESQRALLANEAHRVDAERNDRIRKRTGNVARGLNLTQGDSKVSREPTLVLDETLPPDAAKRLTIWVRNGWASDEDAVRLAAREAGSQSPVVFVYIPKRSADDLRRQIIDLKAATATLEKRGVPTTADGIEAHASIETIRRSSEAKLSTLLDDCFSGALVFLGGGEEVYANSLPIALVEAAQKALVRLYPDFDKADNASWDTVYSRAQKGAPDALKAIGYNGEPDAHPVCKEIRKAVGSGKKGAEIRALLQGAPYGWPQDAVDGGLQVLLVCGALRATDEMGRAVNPTALERKAIGRTVFRIEAVTLTAKQFIELRSLLQHAGLKVASNADVSASVPTYIETMKALAARAGGQPPSPPPPDLALVEAVRLTSGNEQLMLLWDNREALTQAFGSWRDTAARIEQRLPAWQTLTSLLRLADDVEDAEIFRAQAEAIAKDRLLLAEPDPVQPLVAGLTNLLRQELNRLADAYKSHFDAGVAALAADTNWAQLTPEQRNPLLAKHKLAEVDRPTLRLASEQEVLETLESLPLGAFADRVAALDGRFEQVRADASQINTPSAQPVSVPRRTLTSQDDLETWLADVRTLLADALAKGPVILK